MNSRTLFLRDLYLEHPSLKGRLKRNPKSGCLEYIGSQKGHVVGNPLIHVNGANRCMLLRRFIWEKHHGPLPKGKHIRMRCHQFCHEITHMYLKDTNAPYGPMPREYITRFDANTLTSIRYYKGKASAAAISDVFSLDKNIIYGIWDSQSQSMTPVPPGWRPSVDLEYRVEEASMKALKSYLCPQTLQLALKDISRSHLSPNLKTVVTSSLMGESAFTVSRHLGRTKGGILYMIRRGLVLLYHEYGDRKWIRIYSRGNIYRWKLSPY